VHGVQLIRFFDAIKRIDAISIEGCDARGNAPFVLYTGNAKALLLESDLHATGLFDRLASPPGSKHDGLRNAFADEVKGFEIVVDRRFSVYERT
jgi:hypothetical protein